jgi:hypothetical protein
MPAARQPLSDWVVKDKNGLICKLNSYGQPQEGAV